MAALNLSAVTVFPHYVKVSTSTSSKEIKLPSGAQAVTIFNWDGSNDIWIGQNGQADSVAFDTDYGIPVEPKKNHRVELAASLARATSIFVAAAAGVIVFYAELST